MKIGLYFGSFNPIHTGHLIIAGHAADYTDVQQVWLVVSPQNPLKLSATLLNEHQRFFLVQQAIEGDKRLKASDVEFKLPKPSYTVNTLAYLTEKYPEHQFAVLMGSDSFQNLHHWKNHETLLRNHELIIYERPQHQIINKFNAKITLLKAPLLEISATHIRKCIKEGKSIRYLVPEIVREEIEKGNYYKK